MTRALYITDEHERALELAARYLRTLTAVERAHALDDPDEVEIILAGVDPVDVKVIGQELELLRSLYRVAPIVIGMEPRATADGSPPPRGERRSDDAPSSSSVSFFPESRRV